MAALVIYHNPRCSKSRAALALLDEHGGDFRIVRYLDSPPTGPELQDLINRLGVTARALLRSGEAPYKELGLGDPDVDDATRLQAMVDHPILIERPIVDRGDRAVLGRPPENVLELI